MDSLTFNKIAGAVLSALLVIVASRVFVDILYPTGEPQQGVTIQVTQTPVLPEGEAPEAVDTAKAPEAPAADAESVNVLLASASIEAGQAAARKCAACHVWEKGGANRIGPNLYGIIGNDIAAAEGFAYSSALQGKEGEWSYEAMDAFLADPKGWAPGTKMAFAGIRDAKERANLIAFLNQQSDKPLPPPEAASKQTEAPAAAPAGDAPAAPAATPPANQQPASGQQTQAPASAAPVEPQSAAPATTQAQQDPAAVQTR
jgi:cytochrome c